MGPKYLNMRPTPNLLAKGFFGRSVDEFKRLSGIALRAEATKHATKPYVLTSFHDTSTLEDCKLMSDADMGGFSRAHLDFIPPVTSSSSIPLPSSENKNGYAKFHGNISIELPQTNPTSNGAATPPGEQKTAPSPSSGNRYGTSTLTPS